MNSTAVKKEIIEQHWPSRRAMPHRYARKVRTAGLKLSTALSKYKLRFDVNVMGDGTRKDNRDVLVLVQYEDMWFGTTSWLVAAMARQPIALLTEIAERMVAVCESMKGILPATRQVIVAHSNCQVGAFREDQLRLIAPDGLKDIWIHDELSVQTKDPNVPAELVSYCQFMAVLDFNGSVISTPLFTAELYKKSQCDIAVAKGEVVWA